MKKFQTLLVVFFLSFTFFSCSRIGNLDIEAQIIYNMGGSQPVARQTFYLLNTNPLTIRADDPKFQKRAESAKSEDEKLALLTSSAFLPLLKKAIDDKKLDEKPKIYLGFVNYSKPFFQDYLVQEVTTDFQGKAKFENIPAGKYWLLAQTETRAAFALWNLEVEIKPGENKLLLDQNNALYSK